MIRQRQMALIAAASAAIGGGLLFVKASAILLTGDQPPLLFEVAPIFFSIAMYGLLVAVVDPSGKLRTLLQILIVLVAVSAVASMALGPDGSGGLESDEPLSSLLDVFSGLGPVAALIILGIPIVKRRLWSNKWRYLPLALGVGTLPALIVGVILEATLGERYLEASLLLIGAAWAALGYGLWHQGTPSTGP